jgi:hypothetical protein
LHYIATVTMGQVVLAARRGNAASKAYAKGLLCLNAVVNRMPFTIPGVRVPSHKKLSDENDRLLGQAVLACSKETKWKKLHVGPRELVDTAAVGYAAWAFEEEEAWGDNDAVTKVIMPEERRKAMAAAAKETKETKETTEKKNKNKDKNTTAETIAKMEAAALSAVSVSADDSGGHLARPVPPQNPPPEYVVLGATASGAPASPAGAAQASTQAPGGGSPIVPPLNLTPLRPVGAPPLSAFGQTLSEVDNRMVYGYRRHRHVPRLVDILREKEEEEEKRKKELGEKIARELDAKMGGGVRFLMPIDRKKEAETKKDKKDRPSTSPTRSAKKGTAATVFFEDYLKAYLMVNNPSKVSTIPSLLIKYKGRETVLMGMLERKYGPLDPTLLTASKNQLEKEHKRVLREKYGLFGTLPVFRWMFGSSSSSSSSSAANPNSSKVRQDEIINERLARLKELNSKEIEAEGLGLGKRVCELWGSSSCLYTLMVLSRASRVALQIRASQLNVAEGERVSVVMRNLTREMRADYHALLKDLKHECQHIVLPPASLKELGMRSFVDLRYIFSNNVRIFRLVRDLDVFLNERVVREDVFMPIALAGTSLTRDMSGFNTLTDAPALLANLKHESLYKRKSIKQSSSSSSSAAASSSPTKSPTKSPMQSPMQSPMLPILYDLKSNLKKEY